MKVFITSLLILCTVGGAGTAPAVSAPTIKKSGSITTFSAELLTKYVGKVVTLQGKYTERAKFDRAILSPWKELVYFHAVNLKDGDDNSKLPKTQETMFKSLKEGEHVVATGKLYKYNDVKISETDKFAATAGEHFYLDEQTVKVSPVIH